VGLRALADTAGDRLRAQPHLHEVLLLGSVLALDSADRSSIGAVAPSLRNAFALDNTAIGLLSAAFAAVGVVAVIPAGMLTDRVRRVHLLGGACLLWSVAMVAVGAAPTYTALLVTRLFLGALIAIAGPVSVSMIGDLFPPERRGRALGLIDSGELVGAGAGFLLAAGLVVVVEWRVVYWVLAAPGALLAYHVWTMREPRRRAGDGGAILADDETLKMVERAHVHPRDELVLDGHDADEMSLWQAFRWVLRVPTNAVIIVASSVGSMFLAAVQTFGVLFVVDEYGVSRGEAVLFLPVVGAGAFVGTIVGGRLGDRLIRDGRVERRILVAAVAYLVTCAALVPTVLSHSLLLALPFMVVAGGGLGAANAPLDAARLDVVYPKLWGRAESARSAVRTAATAAAPLVFGVLADAFGLRTAFLVSLPALVANAAGLWFASRTYAEDVATVAVSLEGDSPGRGMGGRGPDR
jgi:predicted MFS family arabinose efflux permease